MPQNRIIYNVQDLFAGPPRDDMATLLPEQHLVQRIYRVQSIDWDIGINRNDYKELGDRNVLNLSPISRPDISFGYDYFLVGVSNEIKMGLDVNWNYTGTPTIHQGNTGVSLISGFANENRLNDKRNFYVAINQSGADAHASYAAVFSTGYSGYSLSQFIDPFSPNYHLISFVNSYLVGLDYNISVGDFPRARANYVADNIVYHTSGSGVPVPMIQSNSKTGLSSNYKVAIPRHYNNSLPSALRPGDVTFNLSSTGYGNIRDIGFDLNDAKIQSCSINIQIPREKLEFLGNYYPVDRPIIYPVPVTMSLDYIIGDLGSGSLSNLINNDFEFDASIRIQSSLARPFTGQDTAIIMDLKRAKILSINNNTSIGSIKTANLVFRTELNPDDLSRGFFMSGIIPVITSSETTASSIPGSTLPPDLVITPPGGGGTPIGIIYITNEYITEDGLDIITDETGDPMADEPTIYNPGLF